MSSTGPSTVDSVSDSAEPAIRQSVSVAVIGICGAAHLDRCLVALASQEGAPEVELVVVYDPALEEIPSLRPKWPHVRMVANEGQRSPLELASAAVRECQGDLILLTEDHCIPSANWIEKIVSGFAPGRAAVGGGVDVANRVGALDWAFYFVDFFRYSRLGQAGPSPSLTVCNVGYRRRDLLSIAPLWQEIFHETAINNELSRRFGTLWFSPDARVEMKRQVATRDALYERYAFGRLFGSTRLTFASRAMRLVYLVGSPLLIPLLLFRMATTALPDPNLRPRFLRSLPALIALATSWSIGEGLGYLTGKRPKRLTVAPEREGD